MYSKFTQIRTCTPVYVLYACVYETGCASTCKKQVYNREDYSGSARKEIITLRVRLTRQGTRMHTCDGTRHVICVM